MIVLLLFVLISTYIIIFKKKYALYYFFAVYPVLPDYFAIELGGGLPLLKASRILILLLLISSLIYNKGKVHLPIKRIRRMNMLIPLLMYFTGRILANAFYLLRLSESINTEFSIIFEQLILLIVILQFIDGREQVLGCINAVVCGSGVVACVSIISVFIGQNIFYYLDNVSRSMLMAATTRMGIVRAEAGFGHPVYYGVYCALVIPLSYYLYENKKKNSYLVICILNIVALLLTESRGSIVALAFMIVIAIVRMNKIRRQKIIKIIIVTIVIVGMAFILIPNVANQISDIFKSLFAIMNTNIEIDDFGGNSSTGLDSRLIQFTGIYWTIMGNAVFGLGASCHARGVLRYYKDTKGWFETTTIDNGFVGYFVQEGILGTIGFLALIFGAIKSSNKLSEKKDKSNANNVFVICFIVYFIEMYSVADASQMFWLTVILFLAYNIVDSIPSGKIMEKNNG